MSEPRNTSPSHPGDAVYVPNGLRIDHPDGGYTVTNPGGVSLDYQADGSIEGELPMIRSLCVVDISKVVRHDIARVFDTVSHTLHFEGGGVLSYMHGSDGRGYEFSGHKVLVQADKDGHVMVHGTCPD
ncbi:hypothetical protein [Ralstonia solanacearum]|uniref:Uncharacterized protein n=2 Tax=Ralstonia solanacearum TaxID=305 RepID=F6GAI7_RALS8|nr:hypothetical protein [Ralstonia solanacearum]AEG71775.1 conserved hypothetical protein [Ralstonia solanacearum Po82]AMP72441.1 hypothetical protein UW163_19390 [Ralstonia solanacearum]AMP76410.1 hypothetical protein RALBFv3_19760 [Ralstonia solanacearum]AYB63577.1 hypothetical protein C2124_21600 [Ralstonia solanacearum]MBB6588777.1 hypothetical protein [Ralstonia solanacearum]